MSFTFDPYKLRSSDVSEAGDVLMTNPTALTELESYWASLPRKGGVPERKDVDPSAMAGLLEDSFVLERVAPGVARIRVAGRNVTKLLGIEPRGLPITAAFLPDARVAMGQYLEMAFNTPALIELPLEAPRAVGQPPLQGKMLLLPLRDDEGRVARVLGALVMSGRRGVGGRRFTLSHKVDVRVSPTLSLRVVDNAHPMPHTSLNTPSDRLGSSPHDHLATVDEIADREALTPIRKNPENGVKRDGTRPTLRLVVSNP